MTNPQCPHCNGTTVKNGKTQSGFQRYKCKSCDKRFSESGYSDGRPPEGDRALTNAEKQKRWYEKNKEFWKNKKS